jgi:PKD repeat protein
MPSKFKKIILSLFIPVILMAVAACPGINIEILNVIVGPKGTEVGVLVTFSANSPVSGSLVAQYLWEFGDGISATGNPVTHTYTTPGIVTVQLKIILNDTSVLIFTKVILVSYPTVPFVETGDLFWIGQECDCILRSDSLGNVSIAVSKAAITAVTGAAPSFSSEDGLVFGLGGNMYFVGDEPADEAILKRTPGGTISILVSTATLDTLSGGSVDVESLSFTGLFLYALNNSSCDCIIQIDPDTGDASVYVSDSDFEALGVITSNDLDGPMVGAPNGVIYAANDGTPDLVYQVDPGGVISVLNNSPTDLGGVNEFMTLDALGNVYIVEDDTDDRILKITPEGAVSTFLTFADITSCSGGGNASIQGIAFDDAGNFYLADDNTDQILRVKADSTCSVFVTEAAITAVTGEASAGFEAIAFGPSGF